MSQEEIICVGCPMGCHVLLSIDPSGQITDYSGNECKQGKKYARQEYENPVRIFTATILTKGSARALLPVRTNRAIPKAKLMECARFIAKRTVMGPMRIGDVVISNILDTGADLICSSDLKGQD
jgi:CxxC motif-containing protein